MNKEEDIIYNKTQHYGRAQFVREIAKLQERIEYLERSNNRREDEIIYLRQELNDMEDKINKEKIDKAIELLGEYKHYSIPDEIANRENEELVDKAYYILKGEENE